MITILVLHDDLAFLLWLGKILDRAGYKTVPASSVEQAEALIATFELSIDLLIVNLKIGGASNFAAALRRKPGRIRVVAITEPAGPPARRGGLEGPPLLPALPRLNRRPQFNYTEEMAAAESEWLATLEQVIGETKAARSG